MARLEKLQADLEKVRMNVSELRRRLDILQGIIDVLGKDADEQTRLAARNLRRRIVLEQDREALANAGLPVLKVQD